MEAHEAITQWLAAGDIDDALADRLRTSLDSHEAPEKANRIIAVLASIGAVVIGGGLLLFIASQWDQSSPVRRLLLLLAVYAVTVAGAALAERHRLGITAGGLWFLSSIAVGANIFLVGQIFNLPLNFWQGTLLWMIATLAMGWASPSSAQGWLAVPLGILTLGWISVPSSQFFDQGAFLWDSGGIRPLLPLIGLALVAIAMLVRETSFGWLGRSASAFGALLVVVPITVSTFHPEAFAWIFQIDVRLFHFVVAAAAVVLVALALNRDRRAPLGLALAAVAVLLIAVLPQINDTDARFDGPTTSWLASSFDDSEVLFFGYTAVIFALGVATIIAGHRYSVRSLVNVGFAMVSVLLFALYVGRIAGALPTSLAVIVGGLLLVAGAVFLERKRREVTAEVAETTMERTP